MQAIAVKDEDGTVVFLGLAKKAYIAPGGPKPRVDDEWEVAVVRETPDSYVVRPLFRHEKRTCFKIYSRLVCGASVRDDLSKVSMLGRRVLAEKKIGAYKSVRDCRDPSLPLEIRAKLLKNRLDWEAKKQVLRCLVPWPGRPGLVRFSKHGLDGVIFSKQAGRKICSFFLGHGFAIRGPDKNAYEAEDRAIGLRLARGESIKIVIDTSRKDGFLTDFFKRARVRCAGIEVPVPEGLQSRQAIINYFKEKSN